MSSLLRAQKAPSSAATFSRFLREDTQHLLLEDINSRLLVLSFYQGLIEQMLFSFSEGLNFDLTLSTIPEILNKASE